jgi:hypothetical protein
MPLSPVIVTWKLIPKPERIQRKFTALSNTRNLLMWIFVAINMKIYFFG